LSWASDEFEHLALGDQRLNQRVVRVAERLGTSPHASVPKACGGWPETKGAYRLFDHPEVTPQQVLAPHVEKTRERMKRESVVLCLNDTTEVDFTRACPTAGLGPLNYDFQSGFLLHPLLAVTPDRLCLGVLDAQWMVRDPETFGQSVATKKKRPLEEKESYRWPTAFAQICQHAALMSSTRLVYVADREGDIYELLEAGQDAAADLLIRSSQDRALEDGRHLHAAVAATSALGTVDVAVPRADGRPARSARLTLRSARLTLRPPYRKEKRLEPIAITIIRAQEENPPAGVEPLDWILLTNRSATTLDEAHTLLRWYVCRWQIEIYFRILKAGCGIENLQLETFKRLQVAIAIYLIIAWRIHFMLSLGRDCPDLPCETLFDREEWQAAWIVSKRTEPPTEPPKLQDMIRIIASLGGFLGRKGDGEPGPQTIWIGLDMVRHFVTALAAQADVNKRGKRRRGTYG